MALSLPSYTATIDDLFITTFFKIQPQVIDNVIEATPIWNLLKQKGCFKPQTGGKFITRTIRHTGGPVPTEIAKGTTLPSGETEHLTEAIWRWRYVATHVQRNQIDDQVNNGPDRVISYVQERLENARNALADKFEESLFNAQVTAETGTGVQGLLDILPANSTGCTTGTYGGITRPSAYSGSTYGYPSTGNTFWGPKLKTGEAPIEVNLRRDLGNLYNTCDNNQHEPPDVGLMSQTVWELYEEQLVDASHIVKGPEVRKGDLTFDSLVFKGIPLYWTSDITTSTVMLLNTRYIEAVYDPAMWFTMDPQWKVCGPTSMDRIIHILCAMNMLTTQPRRHGRLTYA